MVWWRCNVLLVAIIVYSVHANNSSVRARRDEDDYENDNEIIDKDIRFSYKEYSDNDYSSHEKQSLVTQSNDGGAMKVEDKRRLFSTRFVPGNVAGPRRAPLHCYFCVYKSDYQVGVCLNPTKFKVHSASCHNANEACFTRVVRGKGGFIEAVVRGCRHGCINSEDTTCCDNRLCNNMAFDLPVARAAELSGKPLPKLPLLPPEVKPYQPYRSAQFQRNPIGSDFIYDTANSQSKPIPPTILFFVTVLLVLQTVVKVAIV